MSPRPHLSWIVPCVCGWGDSSSMAATPSSWPRAAAYLGLTRAELRWIHLNRKRLPALVLLPTSLTLGESSPPQHMVMLVGRAVLMWQNWRCSYWVGGFSVCSQSIFLSDLAGIHLERAAYEVITLMTLLVSSDTKSPILPAPGPPEYHAGYHEWKRRTSSGPNLKLDLHYFAWTETLEVQ